MQLQDAQREQVKLRLSISGPTGYGKTAGALIIAHGMGYEWDKICVIDSENRSASLYANHSLTNGYKIGKFKTIPLEPDFTPEKYTEAIKCAEDAGMEVIIIDSVTHVWKGKGGLLEYNNSLGGRYQDWAKTDPRYMKWLTSILNSKCHVICTSRKKQAYEMTKVEGKTIVEKKGLEDEIRSGFDYEMTIAFEVLNDKHLVQASKDRSSLFDGKPEFIITEATGKAIRDWCELGVEATIPVNPVSAAIAEMYLAADMEAMKSIWTNNKAFQSDKAFIAAKEAMKAKYAPAQTATT